MYKTCLPNSIIGTALILAVVVALLTYGTPASAQESNRPNVGMGDLRRFEAQQTIAQRFIPDTGPRERSHTGAGMGDLHRFEALAYATDTPAGESSHPYPGMGDLRRIEALQANHLTAGVSAPSP